MIGSLFGGTVVANVNYIVDAVALWFFHSQISSIGIAVRSGIITVSLDVLSWRLVGFGS